MTNVSAIICDFKAIGGTLRKQRIDDQWQSAKVRARAEGGRADSGKRCLVRPIRKRLLAAELLT
jgi:hypothetical protein